MRIKPTAPINRPRIMIVGEAPGEAEVMKGEPFVGASGQELNRMLRDAGINRFECYLTNVFWQRPKDNKITAFQGQKKDVGKDYKFPRGPGGKYFLPKFLADVQPKDAEFLVSLAQKYKVIPKAKSISTVLDRLALEIEIVRPHVIIAAGATAAWALLGSSQISKIRGTVSICTLDKCTKVLPVFHPAAILRQWDLRFTCVADFIKAIHEAQSSRLEAPSHTLLIHPSITDIQKWIIENEDAEYIAYDIETAFGTITCISFCPGPNRTTLVVPFFDRSKPEGNYWEREEDEIEVVMLCRKILQTKIPKIAQNGVYDFQWLWKIWGVGVRNQQEDTMLLHHALEPELRKGLAFLASVYTNEPSWKDMRPKTTKVTQGNKGEEWK
jgi:uracil-DNA glycosylase